MGIAVDPAVARATWPPSPTATPAIGLRLVPTQTTPDGATAIPYWMPLSSPSTSASPSRQLASRWSAVENRYTRAWRSSPTAHHHTASPLGPATILPGWPAGTGLVTANDFRVVEEGPVASPLDRVATCTEPDPHPSRSVAAASNVTPDRRQAADFLTTPDSWPEYPQINRWKELPPSTTDAWLGLSWSSNPCMGLGPHPLGSARPGPTPHSTTLRLRHK